MPQMLKAGDPQAVCEHHELELIGRPVREQNQSLGGVVEWIAYVHDFSLSICSPMNSRLRLGVFSPGQRQIPGRIRYDGIRS